MEFECYWVMEYVYELDNGNRKLIDDNACEGFETLREAREYAAESAKEYEPETGATTYAEYEIEGWNGADDDDAWMYVEWIETVSSLEC